MRRDHGNGLPRRIVRRSARLDPWLLVLLLLAAAPRFVGFARGATQITPDSISYLNLARQMRGIPVAGGWDEWANLPRDGQGARTPGYPLFLNAAFLVSGWRPSPPILVERLARIPRFDPWHLRLLATEEDLDAVRLLQHALGLLATGLAYLTVRRWTGRRWLAALVAAAAIGLRPAWWYVHERIVHTEALAATLVVVAVWALARLEGTVGARGPGLAVSAATAAAVLVRPAAAFAAPAFLLGLPWVTARWRWGLVALSWLLFGLLVGGWVVRNGVRYDYWGLSTVLAQNLASHVQGFPQPFTDPLLRRLCVEHCQRPWAPDWILRAMVQDHGFSYVSAVRRLQAEVGHAILQQPRAYIASVAGSFVRFSHPSESFMAGPRATGRFMSRLPATFWLFAGTAYAVAGVAGVLSAFLARTPRSARVAAAAVILSALGVALTAREELNIVRHAFPTESLALMAGGAALHRALDRLRFRTDP